MKPLRIRLRHITIQKHTSGATTSYPAMPSTLFRSVRPARRSRLSLEPAVSVFLYGDKLMHWDSNPTLIPYTHYSTLQGLLCKSVHCATSTPYNLSLKIAVSNEQSCTIQKHTILSTRCTLGQASTVRNVFLYGRSSGTRTHNSRIKSPILQPLSYASMNWSHATVTIRVLSVKSRLHHLNVCEGQYVLICLLRAIPRPYMEV